MVLKIIISTLHLLELKHNNHDTQQHIRNYWKYPSRKNQ